MALESEKIKLFTKGKEGQEGNRCVVKINNLCCTNYEK